LLWWAVLTGYSLDQILVQILCSSVAQSVEQVAVNHPVAGSNPARGANSK
jgi:hypothetical protein